MWPHSLVVGIGDTAICVGTDDAELAEFLERWRIDEEPEGVEIELADYGAELHPPRPEHRGAPRTLANLRHGTDVLARSTDASLIRDGLLRILGSFETPVRAGNLRLRGVPLLRGGAVELAPPSSVESISHRWLQARGVTPVYAASVDLDPETLDVRIVAPLGSDEEPLTSALTRWWVTSETPAARMSFGQQVARAARATQATVGPDTPDALTTLTRLIHRLPPVVILAGRSAFESEL